MRCPLWVVVWVGVGVPALEAQSTARQAVELSGVGRQTANEVSYTYGPPTGPIVNYYQQLFGGLLAGYRFALTPNLALEARGGYLFGRQIQVQQNGGEQVMAHVGIVATVPLGRSRFALRARIAPGVASFSSALRSQDLTEIMPVPGVFTYTSVPHYGRITHFSLEEGVGLSARLSARTSLHFDASHELLLQGDRSQMLPDVDVSSVLEKGSIEDHLLVTVGVSRSFGREFHTVAGGLSEEGMERAPANELVFSYGLQPRVQLGEDNLGLESGFGITGSHFLRPWLALESSILMLPHGDGQQIQDGGAQLQFFAGIKVGLRRPRYGIFVKARPGMISFSNTYNDSSVIPPPRLITEDFAGDMGGVVEVYPSRHVVLRLDLGETLIRYADVTDTTARNPVVGTGMQYHPEFGVVAGQFLVGAGWRF